MKIIDEQYLKSALSRESLREAYQAAQIGMGQKPIDANYAAELFDLPVSLCYALEHLPKNSSGLDSIPFHSLLCGLFLPLLPFSQASTQELFQVRRQPESLDFLGLVSKFFRQPLGLSFPEKIAFLLGDPFAGKNSWMGEDTLLTVLASLRLSSSEQLRQRLAWVGDIALLFIEEATLVKSDPPLTSKEVMVVLSNLPNEKANRRKEVLRDLLLRAGKLERYFIIRLILRRVSIYEQRWETIHRLVAEHYQVASKTLNNAVALSDLFKVVELIEKEGTRALRKMRMQPLHPVSPSLVSTSSFSIEEKLPLWAEAKYNGIRLMLHKQVCDGQVQVSAFTRRKHNWLNFIFGLEETLYWIPGNSYILDCQLHGKIHDWESNQLRAATVAEIYRYLQGERHIFIRLYLAIFDVIYLNGQEMLDLPFSQRRKILENLLAYSQSWNSPIAIHLAEGWKINQISEWQTCYRYFRNKGYEGVVAKQLSSSYLLGKRNEGWQKQISSVHLDLVISGLTCSGNSQGLQEITCYTLSCRDENGFRKVAKVTTLTPEQNQQISQQIVNEFLMTQTQWEQKAGQFSKIGIELLPVIVVTVVIDGVKKNSNKELWLENPQILAIRPRGDLRAQDADTYKTIHDLYLKQSLQ